MALRSPPVGAQSGSGKTQIYNALECMTEEHKVGYTRTHWNLLGVQTVEGDDAGDAPQQTFNCHAQVK
eukprot:3311970-Pyramimonas_sp.AAC.1